MSFDVGDYVIINWNAPADVAVFEAGILTQKKGDYWLLDHGANFVCVREEEIDHPNVFQIGDCVQTRDGLKKGYTIVDITIEDDLDFGDEIYYHCNRNDMTSIYCGQEIKLELQKKPKKCICNFYDREVYGCKCGRILE